MRVGNPKFTCNLLVTLDVRPNDPEAHILSRVESRLDTAGLEYDISASTTSCELLDDADGHPKYAFSFEFNTSDGDLSKDDVHAVLNIPGVIEKGKYRFSDYGK